MSTSSPPDATSRNPVLGAVCRAVAGYLIAALCAVATITVALIFIRMPASEIFSMRLSSLKFMVQVIGLNATVVLFVLSVIPATFFILWSEAVCERSYRVHQTAGILLAVFCFVLAVAIGGRNVFSGQDFLAILSGGGVAGLVYWLVSGRHAGSWWCR